MSSSLHLTWYSKVRGLLKFNEVAIVVCLITAAFLVRVYRLQELMIFTYDQGRDMYVLQSMSRGDLTLIGPTTGLPGVFLGPLVYYFWLPGFVLTNGSPFGVVTWQIVGILATYPFFYLILRRSLGRWWATIGLVMLILTPGSIDQARTIWNPSLVVATLLPSIYALFASKDKPWLLPVSLFFFGLSLQTELAYTAFLAPLYGLWILNYLRLSNQVISLLPSFSRAWLRQKPKVYALSLVLVSALAFGSTLLPQALFEVRNNFLITNSVIREMGDPTKQVPLSQVWEQRPAEIMAELQDTLTGRAPYSEVVVGLVVLATLYILVKKRQAENLFWVGFMWLPLVAFMFHRGNYGYFFDYYITAHYLPALALIVIAVAFAIRHLHLNRLVIGSGLVILWTTLFLRYVSIVYDVDRFQYTAATQMQALYAARTVAPNDNTALEVFVPNLIPVAYQYLSEWMSRTGQVAPMPFGGDGFNSYVLLYEPPIGDGSRMAFEQWYDGWTQDSDCQPAVNYGITSVQACQRLPENATD